MYVYINEEVVVQWYKLHLHWGKSKNQDYKFFLAT